jgi:hypothetical protein
VSLRRKQNQSFGFEARFADSCSLVYPHRNLMGSLDGSGSGPKKRRGGDGDLLGLDTVSTFPGELLWGDEVGAGDGGLCLEDIVF